MNNVIVAGIITVILGTIFTSMGYVLKRSIVQIVQKIDSLETKVIGFKEEMLRDYVRRPEFDKNEESHEKLWINIKSIEKAISKMEGRLNGAK